VDNRDSARTFQRYTLKLFESMYFLRRIYSSRNTLGEAANGAALSRRPIALDGSLLGTGKIVR
jgi:hypothetical protein